MEKKDNLTHTKISFNPGHLMNSHCQTIKILKQYISRKNVTKSFSRNFTNL